MEYKTLNGKNNAMPVLGLGVFRVENDDTAKEAVKHAIISGYRSIDTAAIYGNEEMVGLGIKEGLEATGISRDELFITSKLWMDSYGREHVEKGYQASLDKLGLDYLDLYLIHWPGLDESLMIETWKGMEDLYRADKVKHIGVSNFNIEHLEALKAQTSIKPEINQVEFQPYLTQASLRDYLKKEGIQMESWSPLMNGDILKNDIVNAIAKEHGKSPAQIVIRWNIENDVVVIPKSITPSRIEENIDVFDFALTPEEIEQISSLNEDKRMGPDPLEFTGE
ncbi:aldo/keto reductase [Staphylococcus simulans]|uniref:aldo/keto reductase n=1 Tax=Staphylococcus simulans TaxID=1286 RepID=UPI00399BA479